MKEIPHEKCPDCIHWRELENSLGYCQYTYRTQLFMVGNSVRSMKSAIIRVDNMICDQYEEDEDDIPLSANTDPYNQAS